MTTKETISIDVQRLRGLMPTLHRQESVIASAERSGQANNAEQCIAAYVLRMEGLLCERNQAVVDRLRERAIAELIIEPSVIKEAYYQSSDQTARDRGDPDEGVENKKKNRNKDQKRKEVEIEYLQTKQRLSLESWATHLQASDYPTWFQLYAWDGMSKLGEFEPQKGRFSRRSSSTVASYPYVNPEVLANVYDVVSDDETDHGSFNALYSHFTLHKEGYTPVPEHADEVGGEWALYSGEEAILDVMRAAEATQWCLSDRVTTEKYMKRAGNSFWLFHLRNEETGHKSPTASVAIRLDRDGKVAEISGLLAGDSQDVHVALQPSVCQKLETLKEGKERLQGLADCQTLTVMDRKFQNGEQFSIDELRFLYELDRKIEMYLYSNDPRPAEFRTQKAKHEQQLVAEYGAADAAWMVTSPVAIALQLPRFLDAESSLTVNTVLSRLTKVEVTATHEYLLVQGASVDDVLGHMNVVIAMESIPRLLALGIPIDGNDLLKRAQRVGAGCVVRYVKNLLLAGADLDIAEIVEQSGPANVAIALKQLIEAGAAIDISDLASKVSKVTKLYMAQAIIDAGLEFDLGDIDSTDPSLARHLIENNEGLAAAGVALDVQQIYSHLSDFNISMTLPQLKSAGVDVDVDAIAVALSRSELTHGLNRLKAAGVSEAVLIQQLDW